MIIIIYTTKLYIFNCRKPAMSFSTSLLLNFAKELIINSDNDNIYIGKPAVHVRVLQRVLKFK